MNIEPLLGVVGMASMTVRPGDTSVAQGFSDLPVLASLAVMTVIESACSAAMGELFEAGETTTTTDFSLKITHAVSVGEEVRANVRCIEVLEDLITFEAEVTHLSRTIATAQVQRRLVDRVSYMARVAAERISG